MAPISTFKEYVDPEQVTGSHPPKQGRRLINELLSGDTGALTSNVLGGMQQMQGFRKRIHRAWEHPHSEEEAEQTVSKIDIARGVFSALVNAPNSTRKHIIHTMMKRAHVTHSTAVSYYERLAKEAGITNTDQFDAPEMTAVSGATPTGAGPAQAAPIQQQQDQQPAAQQPNEPVQPQEVKHTFPDNPNKQGIIRKVDQAHLVYKRQTPEGTFEELWIYNIGPDMRDELKVRRDILAGTDIPAQKTTSPDGEQSYSLTTVGNGQMMLIKGLNQ